MSMNNDLTFEMAMCTHLKTLGALQPWTVCRSGFDTSFLTADFSISPLMSEITCIFI